MQQIADAERRHAATVDADKWEILRVLTTARTAYGLTDRDLTVLQALLSFHPERVLRADADLVVHPANRTICDRLNGMPCSTMRRHVAKLVAAGVLLRRDSPNGKRYARRHGGTKVAFGFDLSPLLRRLDEFRAAAAEIQAAEEELRSLRETVSLMRRDLAALTAFGADAHPDLPIWDRLSDLAALSARTLRRKLDRATLRSMQDDLQAALDEAQAVLVPEAMEMGTKGARIEHHYQKPDKDSFEETGSRPEASADQLVASASVVPGRPTTPRRSPDVPLATVLHQCHEIQCYAETPPRRWLEFVRLAQLVSTMIGISRPAWDAAMDAMGPENAAITVAAMLERLQDIHSPGGYLRRLTTQALEGRLDGRAMISWLAKRPAQVACA